MKLTGQMAMDCVQGALASAMDAKKTGIKYTDVQKASVKCHAKDPGNCRFHKTGKFADLKDTEAFTTKLGECSKSDIQDYINEALEAKGLKGQVSLSTYGDDGDKFLAEFDFPGGTANADKIAAKAELENIMFDNGEMLDIKDELASKKQQGIDYMKYAAFKVDGFVNAEESDTMTHPFEQEDVVKPDGDEDGDGSFTEHDQEIQDIVADAVEAQGGKYANPEWDKDDDGSLTLAGQMEFGIGKESLEKALKDAGYASADVHYDTSKDKWVISAGEKAPAGEGKAEGVELASAQADAPSGAKEGTAGNVFAKDASAKGKKVVMGAQKALESFSGIAIAGAGTPEISSAAAVLISDLEDLDYFAAKLGTAKEEKTKIKCQAYLDETLLDVANGQEELSGLVGKALAKVKDEVKEAAKSCDKEVAGFFSENGVKGAGSVTKMYESLMGGDGMGVTSSAEYVGAIPSAGHLGGDMASVMEESGLIKAHDAALSAQHAYEGEKDAILFQTKFGNPVEMKSAAAKLEKAKDAYISALKALKESAQMAKASLMGQAEASKAGMDYGEYQKAKQGLLSIGAKSGSSEMYDFLIGDDGHMTVTKKTNTSNGSVPPKGKASAGEGKGASAAANPSTGYSHAAATKEQKGAAVVAKLEKMIAGCKDPALKAKYEKALVAQKKLFGLGS